MSVLAAALDIPDEPPREWRGLPSAAIGGVAWIVVGVVLARTLALGGFVHPWFAIGVCVAVPATVIGWVLAGPHRFRTWVTTVVMLVAVAVTPLASSGATPSPDRLARIVDHLGLPGDTVRDVKVGNGRCRPACSELRRTAVARGISNAKVTAQLSGILRATGWDVRVYPQRAGAPLRIDAAKKNLLGSFELRQTGLDVTRIAEVWITKGPTPHKSVG